MKPITASWMDEELHIFGESVGKFFEAELVPHQERWQKQGVVDRNFWLKAGDMGLLGAAISEEYGGFGGTAAHDAVILQSQARTGNVDFGSHVHNIAMHYIQSCGTEEQKRRWLPKMVTGEHIGAIAMTEPSTGSDLQSIKTTALASGNEYILNGSKTFITNGGSADIIVVVAKTDPKQGAKGVSLMIVETDQLEGFSRGANLKKIGMKGQDTAELFFDNVRVPTTNLLGTEEGKGFIQLMQQLPWERLILALMGVGICDFALDETLKYVKERKVFGQRVMDFQNTRFKLAEAKTKLEVTRAFVDQCLEKHLRGELDAPTASMAKYWTSQIQCEIVDECLQLFGGYGYMMEYPIARLYTDARVQKIYGGTNEIMKELIARDLDQ